MGAWSSGLYGNDTTCDVRDTYMLLLKEELSNEEAYRNTLEKMHEVIGSDEEPLLWVALAETQWKVGRLIPDVKKKALYWIEEKGGLELWQEDGGAGAGWLKTLEKLKQKLESPMPPEKKIKKPEEVNMNLWEINDVYAYQFNKKISEKNGVFGKYMLIQKIGEGELWASEKYVPAMRIQIYDKIFDELPTLDDLKGLRILPLDFPDRANISKDNIGSDDFVCEKEPIFMSTLMSMLKKFDYPRKHLTFLGSTQGLINTSNTRNSWNAFSWYGIDRWLHDCYREWQGFDYDTVGDGAYDYLGNL